MYLIIGDEICDSDLSFLSEHLSLLDGRLAQIVAEIKESPDPDSRGLFDAAEYVVGFGFLACQHYMTTTFGPDGMSKSAALAMPPAHANGKTFAQIINAAANMWKHSEEWQDPPTPIAQLTIETIETVTPFADYTACNVLTALTGTTTLMALIPILEHWRDNIAAVNVT